MNLIMFKRKRVQMITVKKSIRPAIQLILQGKSILLFIKIIDPWETSKVQIFPKTRVTSIGWHPNYPAIFMSGSKYGTLLLYSLAKGADYHFIPGGGPGDSIFGLKFCNANPYTVYTANMTGMISKNDFNKKISRPLYLLPSNWENWCTCLDICYDRNILMTGDCTGNSYLVTTSGEEIWKQGMKLHEGKIYHCEFNRKDSNIFVTSSVDRTVKLWDFRALSENGLRSEPLLKFDFDNGVSSACFSPSNHLNLLVTDRHSQLRVYSGPHWNENLTITHPHRHFRDTTPIKATWHPIEDIIIVGRHPDKNLKLGDERTIDFYDGSDGELLYQIKSPSKNIVSLNAINSTGDCILLAAGEQIVYMKEESSFNIPSSDFQSDNESDDFLVKFPKRIPITSARASEFF